MDNSPLSRLSAELRNRIAEFAVTHDVCHVRTSSRKAASHLPGFEFISADGRIKHPAGLLQTCKEMKKDCTQLFYASNSFVLHTTEEDYRAGRSATGFLEVIGSKCATAMQGLVITIEKWAPFPNEPLGDFVFSLVKNVTGFQLGVKAAPGLAQCKRLRFSILYNFSPKGDKDDNGVICLRPVFDFPDITSSFRRESDRFRELSDTSHVSMDEALLCMELLKALEWCILLC